MNPAQYAAGRMRPPSQKAAEVQTKYIIVDMYAKAIQGMAPEGVEQPLMVAHVVGRRVERMVAQQHPCLRGQCGVRSGQAGASAEGDELLVEADVSRDRLVGQVAATGKC